jgi:hypothetical protein
MDVGEREVGPAALQDLRATLERRHPEHALPLI